ncbi:MAG: 1-acyl-sn-glycerol-3-phosphate acyltransferase [Thermodesulfobacteriota bacterium]
MAFWAKAKNVFSRAPGTANTGAGDTFSCFLPSPTGILSFLLLKLFFWRISFSDEDIRKLKDLGKQGHVVYATKYKSGFEFHCLHTELARRGAPRPEIGFDYRFVWFQPVGRVYRMLRSFFRNLFRRRTNDPYETGYLAQEIRAGKSGVVSLVDAREFYRRFVQAKQDSLAFLLDLQGKTDKPIYIVPVLILYGKTPPKSRPTVAASVFGTEEKPRWFRKVLSLLPGAERPMVEIAEPVTLSEFAARPEFAGPAGGFRSYALRLEAMERLNRLRQSIVGPVLKTRQELKESILQDEDFREFLREHAATEQKTEQQVHREADRYLEEIAAKYSTLTIDIFGYAVRWFTTRMFDGVDVDYKGLKRLKTYAQKGELILVPCHKSHIDYLIISYLFYINNMSCPLIAAGKNLSFWPMGTIFRNSGAFFLRRSFKGLPLYSRVFTEYIRAVLREGFTMEFFIEGGRSRTGKLTLPKFGLLSILVNAFREGACKNMYFCPIYIGYDRVIEEGSYLHEMEGGEKEAENLSQVVAARRFLKKRFGRIFVRFQTPIPLSEVADRFPVPLTKMTPPETAVLCRNLGHRIIHSISEAVVVTPHSLVSAAMLAGFRKTFTEAELGETAEFLLFHLQAKGAELSETLLNPGPAIRKVIESYVADKVVIPEGRGLPEPEPKTATRYAMVETRRPLLDYYKNNCVHFLIPEAFCALSVLSLSAFQFSASQLDSHYRFLQDFFKNEFHYNPDIEPDQHVRKAFKTFIDDAMIIPHQTLPETYLLTSAGHRKMGLLSNFLRPYFESYLVTVKVLMETDLTPLSPKERVKKCRAAGNRMYKKGEISCIEALSRVNFENASDYFLSRGLGPRENEDERRMYLEVIEGYLKCMP